MRIRLNEFSDREAIRGFAGRDRQVLAHKSASFETRELLFSYAADAATSVAVCVLSGPTKLFAEVAATHMPWAHVHAGSTPATRTIF